MEHLDGVSAHLIAVVAALYMRAALPQEHVYEIKSLVHHNNNHETYPSFRPDRKVCQVKAFTLLGTTEKNSNINPTNINVVFSEQEEKESTFVSTCLCWE